MTEQAKTDPSELAPESSEPRERETMPPPDTPEGRIERLLQATIAEQVKLAFAPLANTAANLLERFEKFERHVIEHIDTSDEKARERLARAIQALRRDIRAAGIDVLDSNLDDEQNETRMNGGQG